MGCVHCLFVVDSHSAASSAADCPVRDDLYGNFGVHHTSVDIPSPRGPSAATALAKRNAAVMEQTSGLYPAWAAWFQKVAQCVGSASPETIWAPPFLNALTWVVKSSVPYLKKPPGTSLYPFCAMPPERPSFGLLNARPVGESM